ncbi:MAG: KpsF/GutQ family sugar-phosphate isomerase [Ignavibacteriae bacterium]|nr:KpsF/GutQ family sugar-phosphate isomerase [Ignavibacteriota bacterium]
MEHNQIIVFAKEVIETELLAIKKASERLGNQFEDAVYQLLKAEKVIISGIGKSGIIARKIAATMTSTGTPAIFLHPVEGLHGDIGIISDNDVVILLSKSGATEELIRIIPYFKQRKLPIISIIGSIDSPIAKVSDIVLDGSVDKEACPLNLAPTASTIASLAIGDALAMVLMRLKKINNQDFAFRHPLGQIGKNITMTVSEVMHTGKFLPLVMPNDNFRNALIESTSKSLGCVCVVDSENNLLGIITDGDVRRILQQNEDIRTLNIGDVMVRNPITVGKSVLLGEALSMMENRQNQISILPVVDDMNKCIGIIRIHDILRTGL